MQRRVLCTALMAMTFLPLVPARAASKKLTAPEIEDLLTDTTITGSWSGARYRQYYDEDGTTIHVANEGRRAEGRWRVNYEAGVYESWWISTGWIPYAMVKLEDGGYAWVNGDRLEPFDVYEGRRIE